MNEIGDRWNTGEAYENYMGRWSRQVAKEFIHWLSPPDSWNWLEVGCGTGALTQAICLSAHPASVVACDPSEQFVFFARSALAHPAAAFQVAGVDELPNQAGGFDAIVSGLVLNFLPSASEAIRAMGARLRLSGMLAAYVWDYAEGMQFLKVFWEEAAAVDQRGAELDEGPRFPLCRPQALVDLLEGEGFDQVEVRALEIAMRFPDFDSYWAPFLGGTGPAPAFVGSLKPDARENLRLRLKERLAPATEGVIQLNARAWGVRGLKLA